MKKLASVTLGLAAIALLALLFSLPLIALPVPAQSNHTPASPTLAQTK